MSGVEEVVDGDEVGEREREKAFMAVPPWASLPSRRRRACVLGNWDVVGMRSRARPIVKVVHV
jgi:hypothetical protein